MPPAELCGQDDTVNRENLRNQLQSLQEEEMRKKSHYEKSHYESTEKIPEYADDIHPYATFCLPEAQCGAGGVNIGSVGTVRNIDMILYHENQTLPLSDANNRSSSVSASVSSSAGITVVTL